MERWSLLEKGSPREAVFEQLGLRVRKSVQSGITAKSAIHKYLESNPADLIVLATEGRGGLPRWLNRSKAGIHRAGIECYYTVCTRRGLKASFNLENGDISIQRISVTY